MNLAFIELQTISIVQSVSISAQESKKESNIFVYERGRNLQFLFSSELMEFQLQSYPSDVFILYLYLLL
jgi:hypothetical protein